MNKKILELFQKVEKKSFNKVFKPTIIKEPGWFGSLVTIFFGSMEKLDSRIASDNNKDLSKIQLLLYNRHNLKDYTSLVKFQKTVKKALPLKYRILFFENLIRQYGTKKSEIYTVEFILGAKGLTPQFRALLWRMHRRLGSGEDFLSLLLDKDIEVLFGKADVKNILNKSNTGEIIVVLQDIVFDLKSEREMQGLMVRVNAAFWAGALMNFVAYYIVFSFTMKVQLDIISDERKIGLVKTLSDYANWLVKKEVVVGHAAVIGLGIIAMLKFNGTYLSDMVKVKLPMKKLYITRSVAQLIKSLQFSTLYEMSDEYSKLDDAIETIENQYIKKCFEYRMLWVKENTVSYQGFFKDNKYIPELIRHQISESAHNMDEDIQEANRVMQLEVHLLNEDAPKTVDKINTIITVVIILLTSLAMVYAEVIMAQEWG